MKINTKIKKRKGKFRYNINISRILLFFMIINLIGAVVPANTVEAAEWTTVGSVGFNGKVELYSQYNETDVLFSVEESSKNELEIIIWGAGGGKNRIYFSHNFAKGDKVRFRGNINVKQTGGWGDTSGTLSTSQYEIYGSRGTLIRDYWEEFDLDRNLTYPGNNTITVSGTIYIEKFGSIQPPNTSPVVSIIQPTSGQSFEKYQKPTLKYNAYDVDGDTMTGVTSVYADGRWQIINTKTGIKNGNTVTVDMTDSVWNSLPSNVNLTFQVELSDGDKIATKSIAIMKLNNPPSVSITEPTEMITLRTDQPPTIKARVFDQDTGDVLNATLQYLKGSIWTNVVTNSNLASGETTSLIMPKSVWETLAFDTAISLRVKVNDTSSDSYSNVVQINKINTTPNVAIIKPIQNEKMFWGYLPFTWQISDIDNDNINLKIWTDTPNIVNNGILYNGTIGKSPYMNNYLSRAYLPLGKHNIFFEFKDGYYTIEKSVIIDIEDIANIHINNNDTFYIPIFNMEKSDIYYRRINNALDKNKYIFNVLELPINQNYVRNIEGMEDVTGDNDYTNNGDRIFSTDGDFNVIKTADWIYSKANSSTNPLIKVVETGNTIIMENILFNDEEKDYTITDPSPRGKDRQFKFEHYPQIYENADSEISQNGVWIKDETFNIFDGYPVVRNGEDITIKLSKSGRYIVSAKEKDRIYNPVGIDFSKESKPKDIELYAHRRPIAKISFIDNGNETLKLESKSYDLDFETRIDKGIQEEIWQYRLISYDDLIVQDWTPIANLNVFAPNINYKTDIRLTVKDYGARIDLINDGELTNTDTITIDATGKPPIANFEYKVGTTLINSVMADGDIYKGNAGKETLQLDSSYTIWNDFFGRATTRSITWSKTQAQLNNEVPTSNKLNTTLTVKNRYNLSDSITKYLDVKDIKINNSSKLTNGSQNINLNITLSSSVPMNKWGNFRAIVTSNELEPISVPLDNTFSNIYLKNSIKVLDKNYDSILNYTVSVYSKRTGELISKENYSLILNSPPIAEITVSPNKIYEGDTVKIKVKGIDPDLDKLTLEVKHRRNGGAWSTIWTKSNIDSGAEQNFNIENIVEGNHELVVTATDPHNATGTAAITFKVLPIKISGKLQPNPAMAGDEVHFFIDTEGFVDRIQIIVPNDIVSKDNRKQMGYKEVSYPLTFNVNGAVEDKEDIFKYIVWVSTDLTIDKDNRRLRGPYKFIVRGYKGEIMRETELSLDIKGDIRNLLKPGIKNKYGK